MKKLAVVLSLVAFTASFAKVKPVADSTLEKKATKGKKKVKKNKKAKAVKVDSAKPAAK